LPYKKSKKQFKISEDQFNPPYIDSMEDNSLLCHYCNKHKEYDKFDADTHLDPILLINKSNKESSEFDSLYVKKSRAAGIKIPNNIRKCIDCKTPKTSLSLSKPMINLVNENPQEYLTTMIASSLKLSSPVKFSEFDKLT